MKLSTSVSDLTTALPPIIKVLENSGAITSSNAVKGIRKQVVSDIVQLILKNDVQSLYDLACIMLKNPSEDEHILRSTNILANTILDCLHKDSKEALFEYNPDLVKRMNEYFSSPNEDKNVTITMTTCKRFDLFQRTVNSMLECISDISENVKEWVVVDDNSSEEALEEMRKKYPFIRWICKSIEDKGHPRSMNIIRKEIKTEFIFHVEDDFEFFIQDNYISKLKEICDEDGFNQALVNIHYSEDSKTACSIWGGRVQKTKNGRVFVEHLHLQGKELEEANEKLKANNCYYWPHFSFRPGLTKTKIFEEIGEFSELKGHFEMEYAYKYFAKGYKSGFLPGTFCTHIGRRTYERNTEKKNAYDLNKESQFGEEVKSETNSIVSIPKPSDRPTFIDVSVINLARRRDRLFKFIRQNNNELTSFNLFDAVDGSLLKPSFKIQKCFETGDYKFRRGIVGCALSHIKLWKRLTSDSHNQFALILEDDAKLGLNFVPKVIHLIDKYKDQFDVLFLHYQPRPQFIRQEDNFSFAKPTAEWWSRTRCIQQSMGSTTGYIVSKNGARKLLNHVNKYGCYNAIDWVMFKAAGEEPASRDSEFVNIMYCSPFLLFADCLDYNQNVDTDIQRDFSHCGIDNWTKTELDWLCSTFKMKCTTSQSEMVSYLKTFGVTAFDKASVSDIICKAKIDSKDDDLKNTITVSIKPSKVNLPKNEGYVWYTTDKVLITVPQELATDEFLQEHTLFENRLNLTNI